MPAVAKAPDLRPPPRASIPSCVAHHEASHRGIIPRSLMRGLTQTTDASASSPLAATMPIIPASPRSMLPTSHDRRIMVTHRFRVPAAPQL